MFQAEVVEKIKHTFNVQWPPHTPTRKSCHSCDNVEKYGITGQATDENNVCIVCCVSKATNTHHQYVALIALQWQQKLHERATNTHHQYVALTALQWEQKLHERASMLRYTYIAFLALYRSSWYLVSIQFNIQVVTTPTSIQTALELMDKSSHFFHIFACVCGGHHST
jgi:hypothetical protein